MKRLTTEQAVLAAGLVGSAALLACWFAWRGRPPQLGGDETAFKTVDALFTAVTAREERLLQDCEQQLHVLKQRGRLPGNASAYLDGVIKKARAGRWESAAERLYGFMKAQRRDGTQDHSKKEKAGRTQANKDLGNILSKKAGR
jgi:hypothetical protein